MSRQSSPFYLEAQEVAALSFLKIAHGNRSNMEKFENKIYIYINDLI